MNMNDAQTTAYRSDENSISIWEIAELLVKKIHYLILAGLGMGIITFFALTLFVAPTYESYVSFYVYNSIDNVTPSKTINTNDLQAAESLAETYSKILESNSVLDAVLEDLDPSEPISRKDLSDMTSISVVANTQLLEVVVTSTDAEFAYDIAKSFVKVAPTEIVRITKAGGVEVVDRPEVAAEKATPRTAFDTTVGIIVGMILMAVTLILKTMADTTIYLPEDIDKLIGATVLGQIPEIVVPKEGYTCWTVTKGDVVRLAKETSRENNNHTAEFI